MSPRLIGAALVGGSMFASALANDAAATGCTLSKVAELPVTMVDMHPMVAATINGSAARFIADSGAFYSMMSGPSAAEFKLKTFAAPWGLRVTGVGGEAGGLSATSVKDFTLAGVSITLHNVEFLVGGGDFGGGGVGLLGQNVFSIADVEYDLANGVIRLIREEGCSNANFAYWTAGTNQTYSMMSIEKTTPQSPHTTGTAYINGVKARVMFDTGAALSVVSERAATRAGVILDGPGVVDAGYSRGVGKGRAKTWIAPFANFKLGDEEIHNTKLRVGDAGAESTDMLVGADFFLSHRVYVSGKQHKLFFTYNGGPVFNLTAAHPPSPPFSAAAQDGPAAEPTAPQPVNQDEPKDAAQFSRRGAAYAARRDFEYAIADLTRACELAPDQPDYFYERGVAFRDSQRRPAALTDFDRAISLKPDHVPALVARAELRRLDGDAAMALADLDAADRAAAKEADARLRMGFEYARADSLGQAVVQLDVWIGAHRNDARLGDALNERCWVRALTGQDLALALDDCNAAAKRLDKSSAADSRVLASRGLVRLRMGDYAKSMTDFDGLLAAYPKDAWALFGRGVDKVRVGKAADGEPDMAAARAAWPPIAEQFKKRGLYP